MNGTTARPERPPASKLTIALCVLLLIVIALLTAFVAIPAMTESSEEDWYDPAAELGALPGKTQEEIQAALDKIVEEGMFNISISSIITFADGGSQGAARIENIAANHYNMSVAITLDEGGETVYESGGIAPGQYIENISLSRDLPPGEYSATALFTAYTTDTLQQVGQAAAKITIIVGS
ncbi:MAG: hypothetical protein Q4C22_06975 [Bacillota bacterium]|nr:hypothetical protein [Bacillota bacterium]